MYSCNSFLKNINDTDPFIPTDTEVEPVRDWLLALPAFERKLIGTDIKTVQFGWPTGMPLVRKMEKELWEVRVHLEGRIARVLFTLHGSDMVLLHGFIKKSNDTPKEDMELARKRLKKLRGAQ
ncbi:MAG: type II toxin-antitoxin system RelE/ParE family toxin [Candidatus Accumulibacter sp.]|jgi:phage-related protein|nr:type II toxin-antitoxin system RelE/ParE family toxin [Accumulibacter sp.]